MLSSLPGSPWATGEPAARVLPALEHLQGVKGRLEIAGRIRGALVVIDYAHKPDALIAALPSAQALRHRPAKRRARLRRRSRQGQASDHGAHRRRNMRIHVIVTDDNPRSEKPAAIRARSWPAPRRA
jgi:UDP-N-acetylmuramoyl-L-alanyl-D-glutamate--2,6-diaminopimelate ligase